MRFFGKKLLAVVMVLAMCMSMTAIPAFAATTTPTLSAPTNFDVPEGKEAIYFNVDSETNTLTRRGGIVSGVNAYDAGGGTITDRNHYLRIDMFTQFDGNFSGLFQWWDSLSGTWKNAGDGYLQYSHMEKGWYLWGLNTWWTQNPLHILFWQGYYYRYVY
jgi:hypothetical protein